MNSSSHVSIRCLDLSDALLPCESNKTLLTNRTCIMHIRTINNNLDYSEIHFVGGLPDEIGNQSVRELRRILHDHLIALLDEPIVKPLITDDFVNLRVIFFRRRPSSHFKTLRNGHLILKRTAPSSFDNEMEGNMWKMMNIVVQICQGILWGPNSQIALVNALMRWETNYGFGDSFVVQSHRLTDHCITNLLLNEFRWASDTLDMSSHNSNDEDYQGQIPAAMEES